MFRKMLLLGGALAFLAATPVTAQSRGTFLIDVGAGLPLYPASVGLSNSLGFGGRLGYMLSDRVGFEADLFHYSTEPSSGTAGDTSVTETPLHVRFTYNAPVSSSLAFILGLGFAYNSWGGDAGTYFMRAGTGVDKSADYGPGGLVGMRIGAGSKVSLRLDLTGDYIPSPIMAGNPYVQNEIYWGADAMVSFALGGNKGPRDSDRDGVPNSTDLCPGTSSGTRVAANGCPWADDDLDGVSNDVDMCPNTPPGATVRAEGCPFDPDRDGVPAGIDQCPDTPVGAIVDQQGCPSDQDNDRVYNGVDQCPSTPPGTPVDAKGCPSDQDADGVADGIDQCPDTPPGTYVTANGCPADADGDGVGNDVDKCPSTARGAKVNAEGCPVLFEAGKSALVLEGITFAPSSSVLDPSSKAILDRVANAVQYNPSNSRLEVAGYTSSVGDRAYNIFLSQQRAEAVMQYLISKGVPATMLVAKGYGPEFPIATNATPAGRAQNRRVELKQIQ